MFSVLKLAFLQLKVAHKLLFDESMKHHQLLLIILITLQIKSYSSAFLIKLLHLIATTETKLRTFVLMSRVNRHLCCETHHVRPRTSSALPASINPPSSCLFSIDPAFILHSDPCFYFFFWSVGIA